MTTERKNMLIRTALFTHCIKQCQLADALGIHEQTLSRRLRHELPESEQKRIVKVIERMANGQVESAN